MLNDLLNHQHSIQNLESFYNTHYKDMSLLHHSFLLYKVNQVSKELRKAHLLNKEEVPVE